MTYRYLEDGSILSEMDGITVQIPASEGNRDYRDLMERVAKGEVAIEPVVEPEPQRQMVLKSIVQTRIIDAGKMPAAFAMLMQSPVFFARWFAPDRPAVYCDDPDAISLVIALGLDPDIILAPEVSP